MSLKCMIDKWLHKGKITQEEYDAVIKKLDGHDKQIIDEFFDNIKKYCRTSSCIGCRFCNDETCEIAVIKEQLKEQNNDNSIT